MTMNIEDVVKEALKRAGHLVDKNVQQANVHELVNQCIMELLQSNTVKTRQLIIVRRVLQRTLFLLAQSSSTCTIGALRRKLDPRYRVYIKPILYHCVQHNLVVVQTRDDKSYYLLNHNMRSQVIEYLIQENLVEKGEKPNTIKRGSTFTVPIPEEEIRDSEFESYKDFEKEIK